jgi:hypothetical protein
MPSSKKIATQITLANDWIAEHQPEEPERLAECSGDRSGIAVLAGRHCPHTDVRASGLWNSDHVDRRYDPARSSITSRNASTRRSSRMIAMIQCAASKQSDAGRLTTPGGTPMLLVRNPAVAPPDGTALYARPDDPAYGGVSWREALPNYTRRSRTIRVASLPRGVPELARV